MRWASLKSIYPESCTDSRHIVGRISAIIVWQFQYLGSCEWTLPCSTMRILECQWRRCAQGRKVQSSTAFHADEKGSLSYLRQTLSHSLYASTMRLVFSLVSLFSVASCVDWAGEIKQIGNATYQCKCYSDHSCYPSTEEWESFNQTIEGRLQRAHPPGAVCHFQLGNVDTFDEAACAECE